MKIDNSNKRYSNIIAGILVTVLVSIFVAFALGIGDSKTDSPQYISPLGVGYSQDEGKDVSKIDILGNNADVAIAKEIVLEATVCVPPGDDIYIPIGLTTDHNVYDTFTHLFDDLWEGYEPIVIPYLLESDNFDLGDWINGNDPMGYHFSLATSGSRTPAHMWSELGHPSTGTVNFTWVHPDAGLTEVIIDLYAFNWLEPDAYIDVTQISFGNTLGGDDPEDFNYWHFWFGDSPDIEFAPANYIGEDIVVNIVISIEWESPCNSLTVQILSQK